MSMNSLLLRLKTDCFPKTFRVNDILHLVIGAIME